MNCVTVQPIMLRQQSPFRYIDEVLSIDHEHLIMCGCIRSNDSSLYGSVNGALPAFLIIESLAQLSGLLLRELGFAVPGQVGYLVSVSEGSPIREWCDVTHLFLQTQFVARVGNILQFDCSFTTVDSVAGQLLLGIGLQDAC